MIKYIDAWWNKDNVRWFHFWYPNSGIAGGAILGVTLFITIYAIFEYV